MLTDAVQLNTSKPGTHKADYVVTDRSGLTTTSTRTAIVNAQGSERQPTDGDKFNPPLPRER
jgi:hypothetical protein